MTFFHKMGIKDFSKVFKETRKLKIKDLAEKKIAIDAMSEIYRAALGAEKIKKLTDKYGNPTLHITVLLANMIEMQMNNIDTIWVFDYNKDENKDSEFHNPAKIHELLKRKAKKEAAKEKIKLLRESKKEELFSDTDEEEDRIATNDLEIDRLEKQQFSASSGMINDIKLILNCLNIKYIIAPPGFEGEQIASKLAACNIVDGVYSGDTDPIPFGSPVLWRKARDKFIYEYELSDILRQIGDANENIDDPSMNDLHKVCLALGCDFVKKKTKGIGKATVLKKLHTIELTNEQKEFGLSVFEQKVPIDNLNIINSDKTPFHNCYVEALVKWLVEERSFTKSRVYNWLNKVMDIKEDGTNTAKPYVKKKSKTISKNVSKTIIETEETEETDDKPLPKKKNLNKPKKQCKIIKRKKLMSV